MFIEQLKNKNESLIKYLPFPLMFFSFMGFNYVSTLVSNVNTNDVILSMINQFGKNVTFAILILPLSFLCVLLLLWVKIFHKQSIKSLTTSRTKVDFNRIFFSFFLWAALMVAVILIQNFIYPEDFKIEFNPSAFIVLFFLAVVLIPLQTSFEEYFFRGYLMQGLGLITKNKWFPLIFTSVTFGLMHIANPEVEAFGMQMMVFYIGTGFFLGIITLMDDGLELALGFHAANNLVGALFITSKNSALQTNAIFEQVSESMSFSEIYVQVFVIFPILIFLFAKKYKWNDWKNKLTGNI
nr:CPBP family intramembrane glutamic endopeptidase [uncultured Flavobacterium sp.]